MTDVTFDPSTALASVQPGPGWVDVFAALQPYGVAVTGARDGDVGVGGFLTGGGNAYLTGRNGFGCDSVANFEVVLADGRIVDANKTQNADLFKALKGGWANFGIVTRFDLETTPSQLVWSAMRIHSRSAADQAATGIFNFTNRNYERRGAAHLVLHVYNTVVEQDISIMTVTVDTDGKEKPLIFDEILRIPAHTELSGFNSLYEMAKQGIDPTHDRVHWFTLTFKNDVDIVKKTMCLHEKMIAELTSAIGATAFSSRDVLQPVPSFFGEIGAQKGGNVLGLDKVKDNAILWLATVAYKHAADDQVAHEKLEAYKTALEEYARKKDADVAWRYINYCDKTQNFLKSYGQDNIDFMKQVAAKFDPEGVFQKHMPGSFKISEI